MTPDFKCRLCTLVLMLLLTATSNQAQVTPYKKTANDVVPPYNGAFQYGQNPGYYDNGWSDIMVANAAKFAGTNSLRLALPSTFLNKYGNDIRKKEFEHYRGVLNMQDLTLFIEGPAEHERLKTNVGNCDKPKVFDNLYLPIWDNGKNGTLINEENYFAAYVYRVIQHYGHHIKFWEVWNEPDYSFSSGAWQIRGQAGNWWENTPNACDLKNLQAPVYYYIRMMRIAYEVIKTYYPNSYVCTGGIGYESFLDVLLRNTDNPDNGKVTPEFPLKGGAYFDVLSFHTYPHYRLTKWNYQKGKFESKRHSDEAVEQFIEHAKTFDSVLTNYGYSRTLPKKHIICTEVNLPRKQFSNYIGTVDAQRNFTIKLLAKSQASAIRQIYLYQTGDTEDYASATSPFSLMGFYENLKKTKNGNQKLTEQGIANKTTAEVLTGFEFDGAYTKQLKNNIGTEVLAFKNQKGEVRLVMWAKTTTDRSEQAKVTYEFPSSIIVERLYQYNWDYSIDRKNMQLISGRKLTLTGTPIFVKINTPIEIINQRPLTKAGVDTTITLPQPEFRLKGTARDLDGKINSYQWNVLYGAKLNFSNSKIQNPVITNLKNSGTYYLELSAFDNFGLEGKDTIKLTVLPEPYKNKPPVAIAGPDITIQMPRSSVTLNGKSSFDVDSKIIHHYWYQIKGPSVRFTNPWDPSPTISGLLTEGSYTLVLRVTDVERAEGRDTVTVFVRKKGLNNPSPSDGTNKAPVAQAGPNRYFQTKPASLVVDGSKSYDPDGRIIQYRWTKVSGPGQVFMFDSWKSKLTLSNFGSKGVYRFRITVTDNQNLTHSDEMEVFIYNDPASTINTGSSGPIAALEESIENKEDLNVTVSPNPTRFSSMIRIQSNELGKLSIQVIGVDGKPLKSLEYNKTTVQFQTNLDVSNLSRGTYFLVFQLKEHKKTIKLLKL